MSTKVTLSYSGSADTGWMDDLAIERLEMVIDQVDDDLALLDEGEHVSGPSAAEYRARIARVSRFGGRVVAQVRNAQRLLDQADPNIHHGEAMTCVWRTETAACRRAKLDHGLPTDDAPDESQCRTACTNLAYTDRDIQQMSREAATMDQAAADPLAPGRSGTGPRPGPRNDERSSNDMKPPGAPAETRARTSEPYSPRTRHRAGHTQGRRGGVAAAGVNVTPIRARGSSHIIGPC